MKIRFLTATVEPGKDGIGDYTLRLASECEKLGHETEIVAFNDRLAKQSVSERDLLRLPRTAPWKECWDKFTDWSRARTKPDWASLQFVPYAFHSKGMVAGWQSRIRGLVGPAKLQMMFHEIWIGEEPWAPGRHRLIGGLQRALVKSLVRSLAPTVTNTSNDFYARILRREGQSADVLPLFGNIPFSAGAAAKEIRRQLGERLGMSGPLNAWIFVIFGALHQVWPPEPLMSQIIAAGVRHRKAIGLVSVGRIGLGKPLWEKMERDYDGSIRLLELGERPADEISGVLQAADFGIATTPYEILGKSGTVAAMREHGLPVIVNRFEQMPAAFPKGFYTAEIFDAETPMIERTEPVTAAAVARQFLAGLATAT